MYHVIIRWTESYQMTQVKTNQVQIPREIEHTCVHTHIHIYIFNLLFFTTEKNKYIWGTRTDIQIDSQ